MKKIGICLMLAGLATAALADDLTTCRTVSNGRVFTASRSNPDVARRLVIANCSDDIFAVITQCNAHVDCVRGPEYFANVSCTAWSRKDYVAERATEEVARAQAIAACSADIFATVTQCRNLVECRSLRGGPTCAGYTCTTESNRRTFTETRDTEAMARGIALAKCEGDIFATVSECGQLMDCRYNGPGRDDLRDDRRGDRRDDRRDDRWDDRRDDRGGRFPPRWDDRRGRGRRGW